MDFRKIEYFLTAAEKLNFTEAAQELHISPQALTQQIANLERELGVCLFLRSTRKITLTEQGVFLYRKFLPVKHTYDLAYSEVLAQFSSYSDIIRVGFFNGLPKQTLVTPWLNLIQTFLPSKKLEIISSDMDTLWHYLKMDKLDICLTNVDTAFPLDEYKYVPLLTVSAQVVISLNHPWAVKESITSQDMAQADMLQLHTGSSDFDGSGFYCEVVCKSIQTVRDFDSMLASLESGKQFAVFPPIFEFQAQANFKYFPLPKEYHLTYYTLCACKNTSPKPYLAKLMDFILEEWKALHVYTE